MAYHRLSFDNKKSNQRITCKLCFTKHYANKYHYCIYKPNVLDLYCGGGGAGLGYYRAQMNITGVDVADKRKNYFGDFIQDDALDYLLGHFKSFDFIHASPPCQAYSKATKAYINQGKVYPDLVSKTREILLSTGKPFVIENVPGAPMRKDLMLRGEMFGLKVIRKRIFEFGNINSDSIIPPHFIPISVLKGEAVIVYGKCQFNSTGHGSFKEKKKVIPDWRLPTVRQTWSYAMGIDMYMNGHEIAQSIPPAYTEFIGNNVRLLI